MSKQELIKYHGLKVLAKGSHGKDHPVECASCGIVFQGRNRAKVAQHISGQEHRRRWGCGSVKEEPESPKVPNLLVKGSCGGLRLGGVFGVTTKLGGPLRSVWDKWVQFADLQRLDSECSADRVCHGCNTFLIVSVCF